MVRTLVNQYAGVDSSGNPVWYRKMAGLSSDLSGLEASNLATGSEFLAVDTGAVSLYDEEGKEWAEVGGGSDS